MKFSGLDLDIFSAALGEKTWLLLPSEDCASDVSEAFQVKHFNGRLLNYL